LIAIGCIFLPTSTSALEFVVTNSRLPTPTELHSVVYDGDDTIYIIGGYELLKQDAVLKFTLSSGAVERVGTFARISAGGAFWHDGRIFYAGGSIHLESFTDNVYNYDPRFNNYTVVNHLPVKMRSLILTYDPADKVAYSFGGINHDLGGPPDAYQDMVLRYDPATNQLQRTSARLPEGRGAGSAAFAANGLAYIFGGTVPISFESLSDEVLKFDPIQNTVVKLSARFPSNVYYSPAVFAKGAIYIAGQTNLFKFDPTTEQVETVGVEGWPAYMVAHAAVYVPKLDRIYYVGGFGNFRNELPINRVEISYLDLSV